MLTESSFLSYRVGDELSVFAGYNRVIENWHVQGVAGILEVELSHLNSVCKGVDGNLDAFSDCDELALFLERCQGLYEL